ncbi:MAG: excinuclease ABC subunit A [Candidatus Magasanikbacteria bacterium RIFCSPHIGHO2_01_FULL_50_8]|uniref:UvrABC system protein A n=1 Tax=Candidatus Magasanikbacteria bacterium RIFCSPHIGHO2_01_FULL_50_8 TaxID=1798674 RepID=A0A1F6LSJ5_9BACT|nr:MAG: excinuclease ABC subunit A [Candidatus Magasanikbacteria bacterium RIFCSPHIGHO2_01_FULL_50_8]
MSEKLIIKGARVHNLKNVSVEIPKNSLTVITGLSGSGKSSLAFDTIYAEGQRRYAESLSSYARQFMGMQDKPDVDEIKGLSPTIAIDQKTAALNPRSTVGTVAEIYDHLRLLFARIGRQHCPVCGGPSREFSRGQIVEEVRKLARDKGELYILAPVYKDEAINDDALFSAMEKADVTLARVDGMFVRKAEVQYLNLSPDLSHTVEFMTGRIEDVKKADINGFVGKALEWGNGFVIVTMMEAGEDIVFSTERLCGTCGTRLPALEPGFFSFNSPHGACSRCTGLGITLDVDPDLVMPNDRLTLAEGAIQPWTRITGNQQYYQKLLQAVADTHGFSTDTPVNRLKKQALDIILFGTGQQTYVVEEKDVVFEGVVANLTQRHAETTSDYIRKEIEGYMRERTCPSCDGRRLRKESLAVTVLDKNIADYTAFSIEEALEVFAAFQSTEKKTDKKNGSGADQFSERERSIATSIIKEILKRLEDLRKVGLEYLTIDRSMNTLSGGEAQRVRLSTQLSSALTGVIYILDEPSIGLHPQDTEKLITTLKSLRDIGNTVIVVEHDEIMMQHADYVIDVGPGAGRYGGEIMAAGSLKDILKCKDSLTAQYLSGKRSIEPPKKLHKGNGKSLTIKGATAFNLRNVDVSFPLGKFVCVTGVSGSGKSTLVIDILGKALAKHFYRAKDEPGTHKTITGLDHIDKVITIDQSPIGRTPRSNPATYTSVFTAIRDLYTEQPEAKMRGYDAGKFSFNVKGGGRCEACSGEGYVRIPMQFLADVYVECDECHGKRYNAEALEIHYRGKHIADVLAMTVDEARQFFHDIPAIADKLHILFDVGLGYLQLGQPATTLSGGEAQRVKLATELSRRATGKTLYILDEPTTGLHFEDIKRLLDVLQQLVEKGNSLFVIEHNLDVVKCADWVIDMGPGGGTHGGMVVAEGSPKDIIKIKASLTAQNLKKIL